VRQRNLAKLRDNTHAYEAFVLTRFRLYSGLFLDLPFERLHRSAQLLPVFAEHCQRRLQLGEDPKSIVTSFFAETKAVSDVDQHDVEFLFLQLIERQIVLFDALEDASFSQTHDLDGPGSVTHLTDSAASDDRLVELRQLLQRTATRIVLTAHPTQFYPATVQGIIEELRNALVSDDTALVSRLLLQLGKTRFTNRHRPTPVEEAERVLDVVADVFYEVLPSIVHRTLLSAYGRSQLVGQLPTLPNLQIGFWPGGDRDGNPFVTSVTTREVARLLKRRVLSRYVESARTLTRRLTFDGAHERAQVVLQRIRATQLVSEGKTAAAGDPESINGYYRIAAEFQRDLLDLRAIVVSVHDGLFVEDVDDLLLSLHVFGFHFAAIDIRQNSPIFTDTLNELLALGVIDTPLDLVGLAGSSASIGDVTLDQLSPIARDTVLTFRLIPEVHRSNGPLSIHRVIISHTNDARSVLSVLALARLARTEEGPVAFDIVPLFESIDDLEHSADIMQELFDCAPYRNHLAQRGNCQTIMVGFSDGTKDGGYLSANLAIRQAKRNLSRLGRERGIEIVFFDGRGGPPARGGGNTHRFYRSRDNGIDQWQQQLTIQGQTVSSNFGSHDLAQHHIEQLFTANLENLLWPSASQDPPLGYQALLDELSDLSLRTYRELRDDPCLLEFLSESSPLPLFSHLTIGSRPASRKQSGQLELEQLRAIPYVATWSILKMQVPGYYGLGSALGALIAQGREAELQQLFRESRFFRTLLDNAAMSLLKSRFDLHAHLQSHSRFSALYRRMRDEAERCQASILRVSRQQQLLANDPINRLSIEAREQIVLPLLVIVQHAYRAYLEHERAGTEETPEALRLRKLSLKGIAAVINATRNAA